MTNQSSLNGKTSGLGPEVESSILSSGTCETCNGQGGRWTYLFSVYRESKWVECENCDGADTEYRAIINLMDDNEVTNNGTM